VPNKPKTQHRSIRIPDDDWDDLGTLADAMGIDRAKAVNQLIRWYIRRPGAKLPERPAREPAPPAGE
jgi:hypothetical protein